jgi:hypothetical protein
MWGRQRHPVAVLALFAVTLGIYWFVWLYVAFTEVARQRDRDFRAGTWVVALAVLYAVFVIAVITTFAAFWEPVPSAQRGEIFAHLSYAPHWWSAFVIGSSLAFDVALAAYLVRADRLVSSALPQWTQTASGHAFLAVAFVAFNAVSIIGGGLGAFLSLVGFVLSIVWVSLVQGNLNKYWARMDVAAAAQPQRRGFPGGPGFSSSSAVTQDFWFEPCPRCGGTVKAPLIEGIQWDVSCSACGATAVVRVPNFSSRLE